MYIHAYTHRYQPVTFGTQVAHANLAAHIIPCVNGLEPYCSLAAILIPPPITHPKCLHRQYRTSSPCAAVARAEAAVFVHGAVAAPALLVPITMPPFKAPIQTRLCRGSAPSRSATSRIPMLHSSCRVWVGLHRDAFPSSIAVCTWNCFRAWVETAHLTLPPRHVYADLGTRQADSLLSITLADGGRFHRVGAADRLSGRWHGHPSVSPLCARLPSTAHVPRA